MYIFNGQSEFFRHPQGGTKARDEITIKIYIKKSTALIPKIKIEKRRDYNNEFYKEVPMKWIETHKSYDLYKGVFSIREYGQYFYNIIVNENTTIKRELLIYKDTYTTPEWIKGGIIYHIFVDRFYRSKVMYKDRDIVVRSDWGGIPHYLPTDEGEIENNDFFGGNLDGIKEKLPYLYKLGVTTIYLSPIFDAYSNHKYDVGDYLSIDPMFGNESSLMDLCREAESYGMGIILDGVFSHTGADSIYFNKYGNYNSVGAYESQSSPYYNWYMFNNWNDDYVSWWGIETLPTINKNCEEFIDFITDNNGVLKYWQTKGIKGWRLDVADELPNEFLEKLRLAVKEQDNEAYIVGEVWEDGSNKFSYGKLKEYFCGNQLDSVTNYPLKDAIINYLTEKDCTLLNETMNLILEKYPSETVHSLMNILGTHDTARILTVLGVNEIPSKKQEKAEYNLRSKELNKGIKLLKIASLLQFTLPGIPCIYYGDEAGVEGFEDPFNRACFPWGKENHLLINHYEFLARLRKNELFAKGNYKNVIHDKGIFVFERYDKNNKIVIAVNMSEELITLELKEIMNEFDSSKAGRKFELGSEEYLILYRGKR